MPRATTDQLKQWLADTPGDMDPYKDTLDELLEEAQELMEYEAGRVFETESAQTRYYRVAGGRVAIWDVYVEGEVSIYPTVKIDLDGDNVCEQALTFVTDVVYAPLTDGEGAPAVWPLYLDPVATSAYAGWPDGALVEVGAADVGNGGSGELLRLIQYCTVLMAARLWGRRQSLLAQRRVAEAVSDEVTGEADGDYERMLALLRHPHLAGLT